MAYINTRLHYVACMYNAPATFQWLINQVTAEVNGCKAYIDDVIIYSDDCSDHVKQIKVF